jgi:hypothetical protein
LRELFAVIHRREALTAEAFGRRLEAARAEVLRCGTSGLDHRLGHCIEDQAAERFRLERGAAGRAGTSSRSRTYSNRSRGLDPKKRSAAVVPSGRRIR